MPRTTPTDGPGRRPRRRLVAVGVVALLLLAASCVAIRHQPTACRTPSLPGPEAERGAARLVTKTSALSAGLERPGEWGEAITDGEINAWLAHDLPRVAPTRLPTWMASPAVRFLERRVALSATVAAGPLTGRVWAILTVVLPRDNVLEIEVESAGIGIFPLPSAPILKRLAAGAQAAGLTADIRRDDGHSSLVLLLPGRPPGARGATLEYHLEGLRIDDGEMVLSGSTRPAPR